MTTGRDGTQTLDAATVALERAGDRFERAWERFTRASRFARQGHIGPVLDTALALLQHSGGAERAYACADGFDHNGLFDGSDWAHPELLRPELVDGSLGGPAQTIAIELLSQLRLLAIVDGRTTHPRMDADAARGFLETALALNLARLFPSQTEAVRIRIGQRSRAISNTLQFVLERIGPAAVTDAVLAEAEGMLAQRPIQVNHICRMLAELGRNQPALRSAPLFDALFRPSPATRDDPGVEHYRAHLGAMTDAELTTEADAMAGHLVRTGLASAYHAVLVRHLRSIQPGLLPRTLGLSSTGTDAMHSYHELVLRLIDETVFPETAQTIYGLHALLERGALYFPPVPAGLWRQIVHPIRPEAQTILEDAYGDSQPPRVWLLAGLIQVLGQPLGIGQGNNPTCQSARALSLWAQSDPGYLLQLLLWVIRDGNVVMSFEGESIASELLDDGLAGELHTELDPVSLLLVPHLDRIYAEMWRRVASRSEDGHRWINPEFHGWWVQRGFAICVDVASGDVVDFDAFTRRFHAHYHPYYNGNQPVIFPQPAGIASTTPHGEFVGWHAISIQRVGLDPGGTMRVYFNNPNNEGRQHWGDDVVTSVAGCGEIPGESSLPFEQFCARLYLFHYDPAEAGEPEAVPARSVAAIRSAAAGSWAAGRRFRDD